MWPFIIIMGISLLILFCPNPFSPRKFIHWSKTGAPFIERDADGFLTPESYESHIKYYYDGGVEVNVWALSQTRSFNESIAGMKTLKQFIQSQKKS